MYLTIIKLDYVTIIILIDNNQRNMTKIRDENIFSMGSQKLFQFPSKVTDWLKNKPISPIALEIQPSEKCNHNCPQCQSKYSMSFSEARQLAREGSFLELSLLDKIWKNPPNGIIISGNTGDPLLHPRIDELLLSIASHDVGIVLITNGQNINDLLAEIIVKTCEGVRISLDAYDSESFKKTHGADEISWNSVLANIKKLIAARERMNKTECTIGVGYLTNKQTVPGMRKATLLAKKLMVDYIQFRPFHYDTCEIDNNLNECRSFVETDNFKVICSAQKYNLLHNQRRSYSHCYASAFYTAIDAKGDVYVCCHHIGKKKARLGSLKKDKWKDILKNRVKTRLLDDFPDKKCVPLCRLHPHNSELNKLLEGRTKIIDYKKQKVNSKWVQHAKYL